MTAPATQLKVGLFVIVALGAVIAVAIALGISSRQPGVRYHTYIDESAQGLEIGAPIDYRGVRIGAVQQISIAPDMIHIDIALDIDARTAERLALDQRAPTLRARVETQGITGVKYIDLEPQGAHPEPAPTLGFVPDRRYIVARPSLISSLSIDAERIARAVPALLDNASTTVDKLNRILDDIHDQRIVAQAGGLLADADAAVHDVRRLVGRIDGAGLPALVDHFDAAVVKAGKVLERFDHIDALIASGRHAMDSLGALGTNGGELERTIRDLGAASRSLRELLDDLQHDPEMLLKGRAKSKGP